MAISTLNIMTLQNSRWHESIIADKLIVFVEYEYQFIMQLRQANWPNTPTVRINTYEEGWDATPVETTPNCLVIGTPERLISLGHPPPNVC